MHSGTNYVVLVTSEVPNIVLIETDKHTDRWRLSVDLNTMIWHPGVGGTQLSFWYMCASQKAELRCLWTDHYQIWDPSELNFCPIWGFRTELFLNFEALGLTISRNLWFGHKSRGLRTEKCWNGGLVNSENGCEKGVSRAAHTRTPFFSECLPRVWHKSTECQAEFLSPVMA